MTVTAEQLTEIAREVWTSFLDLGLSPWQGGAEPGADGSVTGCVHISGSWEGSVLLQCAEPLARLAAATMFGITDEELGDDEVADAVGELTNMVGGNVKSLLPEPSRLSLPAVTTGREYVVHVPGAEAVEQVALDCKGERLLVSVCRLPAE